MSYSESSSLWIGWDNPYFFYVIVAGRALGRSLFLRNIDSIYEMKWKIGDMQKVILTDTG